MKLTRKLCFLVIFTLFAFAMPLSVSAQDNGAFSVSISQGDIYPGDKIKLSLSCDVIEENVGAFIVRTEYDSSALNYVKHETGPAIKSQYIQTAESTGSVSFVYTNKLSDASSSLQGELLSLTFTAGSNSAEQTLPFKVYIEQIADKNGNLINAPISYDLSVYVLPAPSNNCNIISLVPDTGELSPAFDPEITAYEINLPFETTKLDFDVETVLGATWKINRKNLGAGGSAVDFLITVTSEDKTASKVYTITANRAVKGAAVSSSSKTSTSAKTTTSSSKSQTSVQNKANQTKNEVEGDAAVYAKNGASAKGSYPLSASGGSHLVIESGGFPPFLWGVFGSFLLILIIYVLGLQLKLLIVSKEKKTEPDKLEPSDTAEITSNDIDENNI